MAEKSIFAFRDAAERAGLDYKLGEGLSLGIFYHLADSRERAVREITPWYEEHVKMFGPLGFVPGITPAQLAASTKRGGWGAAGVPTVEHYMKTGAWFAGPPRSWWPSAVRRGSTPAWSTSPEHSWAAPGVCEVEQLAWLGRSIMPAFVTRDGARDTPRISTTAAT